VLVGVSVGVSVTVGVGVSVGVSVTDGVPVGVSVGVGVGLSVLVGVTDGVPVGVSVTVGVGVSVGVTDGTPTCITIELAFAPEPQLQVYVPGVAPKVANVVELNVVVPLMNEPDVYPDGTNNLLVELAKPIPKKSPVAESPSV
jgi:hypothetical protein